MTEDEERQRVIDVARTFIGTPYKHGGYLKGVGVDCATVIVMVYREAGLNKVETPAQYSPQWFMHRSEEKYLHEIEKYAHRIEGPPKKGDLAVWQMGRTYAHGAIVVDWPNIIHAYGLAGAVIEDRGDGGKMADRPVVFYSRW